MRSALMQVLSTADPKQKIALTHQFWRSLADDGLSIGNSDPPDEPARPCLPKARTTHDDHCVNPITLF